MLDELVFDQFFLPFVYRTVNAKASVFPHIFNVVAMRVVVKGGVFEFIGHIRMKNCMVLCESHQDWF